MEQLTNTEYDIMQIIWKLGRATVRDVIVEIGNEEIPHSTISSVVRILEKKGFVDHKAYGRTHEYFPIIPKEKYGKKTLSNMMSDFFNNSPKALVSFLVKEKKLSPDELKKLADELEKINPKNKSK